MKDYFEWIDDLRIRGLISVDERQAIAHMLRSERASVVTQGLVVCKRMRNEHPDLWLAFKAKQRILGLSKSN